ncbi:MAG: hypothetical protein ACODAC_01135 [Pseudomonadota bacterium]
MSGRDDEDMPEIEGEENIESTDEDDEELEEEYAEDLGEEEVEELEDGDEDLKVVDEALSHRDSNARALAIRRAIEERMEAKRLSRDLDYLDLDLDADD